MYNGDTKYRTEVGSAFTVILLITLLSFISAKLKLLVNQDSEQNYSQFSTDRDLYGEDEHINLYDNQFQFAFGSLNGEVPEKYGRFTAQYIEKVWDEDKTKKVKIRRDIPIVPCGESEVSAAASDFIKNAPGDFIRKSGLRCLQKVDEDMELKGHYHTDDFFYLNIALELCPTYGP